MPEQIMFGKKFRIRELRNLLQIESQLGTGGSGAVYKAWHKRLCKYVVVKEVRHSSAGDMHARRNEVEALKNVKNAHLPQVFDFLTKGKISYTVMEFIEGESFDKLLGCGQRYTGEQVAKWYAQLASALETIHKQGICHRDIKPSNIMLTPSGDICLIDFNAALVGGNGTRLVSRSLGYASPEQYDLYQRINNAKNAPAYQIHKAPSRFPSKGSRKVSGKGQNKTPGKGPSKAFGNSIGKSFGARTPDYIETRLLEGDNLTQLVENSTQHQTSASTPLGIDWKRSDIYSLGATMYHLLEGKLPPATTTKDITKEPKRSCPENRRRGELCSPASTGKTNNRPPPSRANSGTCHPVMSIIERSLHRKPSERYASATALSEALSNMHEQKARKKDPQPKKLIAAIAIIAIAILFKKRKHHRRAPPAAPAK